VHARFFLKGSVNNAMMIGLENPSRRVGHEKNILSHRPAENSGHEKQRDELNTLSSIKFDYICAPFWQSNAAEDRVLDLVIDSALVWFRGPASEVSPASVR